MKRPFLKLTFLSLPERLLYEHAMEVGKCPGLGGDVSPFCSFLCPQDPLI